MSSVAEIESAIASLPPEQWEEIRRWINSHEPSQPTDSGEIPLPDFLARQRQIFNGRVLSDSQPDLDELRGDRF